MAGALARSRAPSLTLLPQVVGVRCATAAGLECVTADGEAPELHGGFAWGAILQLATKHCRQSSRACPENQWQCKSGECVPANFLCDSAQDCKDGSDEDDARCEASPQPAEPWLVVLTQPNDV